MITLMLLLGAQVPVQAQQVTYEQPSWKFGVAVGANANYYQGTTQLLNEGRLSLQPFGHGNGFGLFTALTLEYHRPKSWLGFMLQGGFDSRRGVFDQVLSPCNCPLDLSTELSYLSVEPSFKLAPFRSNFYIFGGPRFAFLRSKSFEYEQQDNPDFPNTLVPQTINGDFDLMQSTQISMQIGAGLDIPMSSKTRRTQYTLSPFVSYHPYVGQTPRSVETWNITTIRAGIGLKFGRGKQIESAAPVTTPLPVAAVPVITFAIDSPANEVVAVRFVETFPLRNYVFFDPDATVIPARYTKLTKEQALNFKEDQLGRYNQVTLTGRSDRQMSIYHNILNILGDRMVRNPSTTIRLTGTSQNGAPDARLKAEAVKTYLVNIFGIAPSRITTDGHRVPTLAAGQRVGSGERALLRQEDSRVAIESTSPVLLKEYQTGPVITTPTTGAMVAPNDSYVTFTVTDASNALESWKLEVRDQQNRMQPFGPYTANSVQLSGASILGTQPRGTYTITMIGKTRSGDTIQRTATTEVVQWITPVVEHGNRFSVIFEFDRSVVSESYEKYLMDVVLPSITEGSTVRIQGYSDTIGDAAYNLRLSQTRAEHVQTVLQRGLARTGRTGVVFQVTGNGDLISKSQFPNTLPEERFYNRSVVIDITPRR